MLGYCIRYGSGCRHEHCAAIALAAQTVKHMMYIRQRTRHTCHAVNAIAQEMVARCSRDSGRERQLHLKTAGNAKAASTHSQDMVKACDK